jgi:dTDP-4-amino-4,6-dideoxygalactose transaminase
MENIRFYGLDRQFHRYRDEFLRIADEVLQTGQVLQGPAISEFEEQIANLCGRRFAVATGSCTDALAFSLLASNIGPGDEVIVTCYSFIASVSPILRVGAKPVFVDIESEFYMMDVDKLDALVSPKTKAILAVHLFGQCLSMSALERFAEKHGLIVIDDSAQALGSHYGKRPGGSLGIASALSFDPTKVVGAFGSGGVVLTDSDEVANQVRALRYHGRDFSSRRFEKLGYNSQMATEQAAMLCFKLKHMAEWQEQRSQIANIYREGLVDLDSVKLPKIRPGSGHTYHKFVIRAKQRNELMAFLKRKGIESMIHYATPLCDYPWVRSKISYVPDIPVARAACEAVLSLPIYPDLSEDEAFRVVETIRSFYIQE